MDCPKCGSGDIRATATNGHQADCVTRKRKCQVCSHQWFTLELPISDVHVTWRRLGQKGQSKPTLRVPVSLAVGDRAV